MDMYSVTLNDKYTQESGRIYLTGIQAIVRLPMMQHRLDQSNGLETAGFISGYRGSPLGAIDLSLASAAPLLKKHNTVFHPGINEDLGATAVWGSQQVNISPHKQYDGVFGIWYGKGPGVDRSLDAIKHANAAGTGKHGGVLAMFGDDHACKSSTFPHQSEQALMSAMVPVLNPANVKDILDLGLHGIAMSRYSGCWIGIKCITDSMDSSASIFSEPDKMDFIIPDDFDIPEGGLNIRWPDPPVEQEDRLVNLKLPAARAYARANGLDKVIIQSKKKKLGLVATGKAFADTMQALEELGIDEKQAAALGISIYKVALTWPMEETGLNRFAQGMEELLVIEEKRGLMEDQIKRILFNLPQKQRPRVVGKRDVDGTIILPETYELSPRIIAHAIVDRLRQFTKTGPFEERLAYLDRHAKPEKTNTSVERMPWYCSGCPHNTSTVVPKGSRALAGIGCHYMAMWMGRETTMFSQMGGEGVPWIGQAPFTKEKHVFVNLGDGTYFHSGLLAIRAALAGNVNITYKILYNDAVAMTGGQHVDGELTVDMITRQVAAEGVKTIYVVTDEPEKYPVQANFAPGTKIAHRDDLDKIQKELRETPGVTVLIYDQTCAAEKRRRRKRGLMVDPPKRVFINEQVCEGCGDCSAKSNCLSVVPVETEFGRKRQIDQSTCNKDFSCVKGFCPSFVTVHGGKLKRPSTAGKDDKRQDTPFDNLPTPKLPDIDKPYNILVTGIGGTGVVTIGALLAMAAHLEGKGSSTLDQTGLAQKGGSVTSHIRIARTPDDLHALRLSEGSADLLLGCDIVVSSGQDALSKVSKDRTHVILNTHNTVTGEFTHNPDWKMPVKQLEDVVRENCGEGHIDVLEATQIATKLLGNSIATNLFMLGFAWQKGRIPLTRESLMRAVELNGVAVGMNQKAFMWGRMAAHDMAFVQELIRPADAKRAQGQTGEYRRKSATLEETIERRRDFLTAYQNAAYAKRYLSLVETVRTAEKNICGDDAEDLTAAVARYYFKLMAYKDEYEVARLYSQTDFKKQIEQTFEGKYRLHFHLAPPLLASRDPDSGELKKSEFGPWVFKAFGLLARLRFLRGTPLDIFGYTHERKTERQLIDDYKDWILRIIDNLTKENHAIATEIASIPEKIRGYGHVKEKNLHAALEQKDKLFTAFYSPEREDNVTLREAAE